MLVVPDSLFLLFLSLSNPCTRRANFFSLALHQTQLESNLVFVRLSQQPFVIYPKTRSQPFDSSIRIQQDAIDSSTPASVPTHLSHWCPGKIFPQHSSSSSNALQSACHLTSSAWIQCQHISRPLFDVRQLCRQHYWRRELECRRLWS